MRLYFLAARWVQVRSSAVLDAQESPSDIRLFLQAELVRRCKVNPKYSLRAFAKLLGIESSALSKILNGKRTISRSTLRRIAPRVALSPQALEGFERSLVERRGRQSRPDPEHRSPLPSYQQMALDHFQVISDWYHFAILELIAVDGFKPKISWIARSLGITVSEVNAAIERLQRLELLEIRKDGKWIDRAGDVTSVQSEFTATALRKFQAQILSKAILALEEVPIELRDNTGMTMAIDQDLLPEAKNRIKRFRRELCAFLQSGEKKNAVYQMGIALYPITNKTIQKKTRKRVSK